MKIDVAPLAGAWIEILYMHCMCRGDPSLPSRERGLKSQTLLPTLTVRRRSPRGSVDRNTQPICFILALYVAPLAGAWIEISSAHQRHRRKCVAPLAGAWIEISG